MGSAALKGPQHPQASSVPTQDPQGVTNALGRAPPLVARILPTQPETGFYAGICREKAASTQAIPPLSISPELEAQRSDKTIA